MNEQNPRTAREQFEVRITALLLGEASDFEEAELLHALEQDLELKAFYNRMRQTVTQLEKSLAASSPSGSGAPKLSPDRRKQLEQLFKKPKPSATQPSLPRPELNRRSRRKMVFAIAAAFALLLVASGLLLPAKISKSKAMRQLSFSRELGEPASAARDKEMLAQREQRPLLGISDEKLSERRGGVNQPVSQAGGQQEATTLSIASQSEGAVQTATAFASSAFAPVKPAPIFLPEANPEVAVTVPGLAAGGAAQPTGQLPATFGDSAAHNLNLWMTQPPVTEYQTRELSEAQVQAGLRFSKTMAGPASGPMTAAGEEPGARANRPLSRELGFEPAGVPEANSPVPTAPPATAANGRLNDRFSTLKDDVNELSDFESGATGAKPYQYNMDPQLAKRYGLVIDPRSFGSPKSAGAVPPTGRAQLEVAGVSRQKAESEEKFGLAAPVQQGFPLSVAGSASADHLAKRLSDLSTSNNQPSAGWGFDQFGNPLPPRTASPPVATQQSAADQKNLASREDHAQKKLADLANRNVAFGGLGGRGSSGIVVGGLGKSTHQGLETRNEWPPVTVTGSSSAPNSSAAMYDSFAADGVALPTFDDRARTLSVREPRAALDRMEHLDRSDNAATPLGAAAESKQLAGASKPISQAAPPPAARPELREEAKAKNSEVELAKERMPRLGDTPVLGRLFQRAEPLPEISAKNNPFSTFSLNVSDVSFQLAAASLEKNRMPDAVQIRSEEFVNAFDYHDPAPAPRQSVAFAWERARNPFAHNRELLRLSVQTAAVGRQPGQPLNLVVVLDNSGSMERADRVRIIEEMLTVLAGQLRPEDRVSVIAFARTARLIVDGMAGGDPKALLRHVVGLNPSGGTNFEEAMRLAYETAAKHFLAHGNNRVILLTDGAANLGNLDPQTLRERVIAHRQKGIALDCFGIGWEDYNDRLLEVLSRNGDGRYAFINDPEAARTEFAAKLAGALQVAAADVKVQIEFNPNRVVVYRQIGYQQHQLTKEQFRDNRVDAAEIGAAESGNALYSVELDPNGNGPIGTFRLRYRVPSTGLYEEREWPLPYTMTETEMAQASPALRLAATAASFAEWLAKSPYAQTVAPEALLNLLRGVPEIYSPDPRPGRLFAMIQEAISINGK